MPKLDRWFLVYGVGGNWHKQPGPYTAPEDITAHLSGVIFGDHRFLDGDHVTTSTIKSKSENKIITNSGTYYDLGSAHPDYEREFPNAKERLFNSLKN